jgi:hypothetical protein
MTLSDSTNPRVGHMLEGLDLQHAIGAEIGPLDKPLVPWRKDRVLYVDHCGTEELRRRWSTDPNVDASKLHVDAVWGGKTLRQAISAEAGPNQLDYVVASHVVEHVPDLIGWLREVEEVLRYPGGSLRLAVPDRRYTFDVLRRESTLVGVLDAHVRSRRVPSSACVLDFALHMAPVDCSAAWDGTLDRSALRHVYTQQQAISLAKDAEQNGTYHDVHCWVFTPRSFAALMADLSERDMIGFSCAHFVPTLRNTFEFFTHLTPERDRIARTATWSALLQRLGNADD